MPRTMKIALPLLGGLIVAGSVLIAFAISQGGDPDPGPVPAPAAETPAADPYEAWLERAPADAPDLSRDDALTRAYLGCGQNFPPGTTDGILAEVYADYVDCAAETP